ncbi:MAG: methionine--tRNA ligase [Candidatus Marsarchaeota archaeon]|nr:methionine--tRNA ligase [Candidatus Marsarchaeota archaeon]
MGRYLITAALPYSYSVPHLGNFVGSVLPADVYHKYLKMRGDDAIYVCGSDQHGTPTELAAIKAGVAPEVLADEMHEKIKKLFEKYECTFTYYGKTNTPENKGVVYSIFNELYNNGYLLEREDMQAYCNVDERFLTDRLIEGTCPYCHKRNARGDQCDNCGRLLEPAQIKDPFCAICGKSEIRFVKTKNLALELNKLQGDIAKFIKKTSKNNWSKDAVNKSLSMIKEGLKPRDITRNMKWGFPVPLVGYENSVIYVWITGLIGYIGITKQWDSKRWRDYWQNEHTQLIQFLGKDNTIFHTIIWPGMAMGSRLGFILPHTIKESQFLVSKTLKFSKSHGVGLNMKTAIEILGADYWRFSLMYMYPENADSEFSERALVETVNTIMNDKIGNLAQRVLKLSKSNRSLIEEEIPSTKDPKVRRIIKEYEAAFDKLQLKKAIGAVVKLAELGNSIMSDREPWVLAKNAKSDAKAERQVREIFSELLSITYQLGILLYPFTPRASAELLSYFGIRSEPTSAMLNDKIRPKLDSDPKPIFQKITDKETESLRKYS